jgi:hypothetical protein
MTGGIVDRSGTITTGGTAQNAMSANKSRRYLLIQNLDASEDMYVRFDGTAAVSGAAGTILLKAGGGAYEAPAHHCPTAAVSVIAATAGHKFTALEG